MSCGAAAKGGDVKITNIVLQDASFQGSDEAGGGEAAPFRTTIPPLPAS